MESVAQVDRLAAFISQHELDVFSKGCALYPSNLALISVSGRDRVRWLNGMISNNVRDLGQGCGVYAFVLNAQGQIQGDLFVLNLGETLLMVMEEEQKETLLPLLRRYIIMDKVEFEEVTKRYATIVLAGPKAEAALASIGLKPASESALSHAELSWHDSPVLVVRGDNPIVPSFWLWAEHGSGDRLREALLQAGGEKVSAEALEALRILCGIPRMRVDIREKTLPQETGQERALNFAKGCFIGQEIVERIRARGSVHRVFTGFEWQGTELLPGTKIQADGKDVGELTSVARIANVAGDRHIGLGYLRREFVSPDKSLVAGTTSLKPATLPFRNLLKSE
jgi:folate-binding protein YgfZ